MRSVTDKPIKFLGVGEKLHQLECYSASRIADRILGAGDIISLVEKAAQNLDQAEVQTLSDSMGKGFFYVK